MDLPAALYADTVDRRVVADEARWWNFALDRVAIVLTDDPSGAVAVSAGDLPPDILGITRVRCGADGSIGWASITIASELAPRDTHLVLRHEIGHILALADDCGPPVCVELRSVMGDPLDPLGALTDHDLNLLSPYMDGL